MVLVTSTLPAILLMAFMAGSNASPVRVFDLESRTIDARGLPLPLYPDRQQPEREKKLLVYMGRRGTDNLRGIQVNENGYVRVRQRLISMVMVPGSGSRTRPIPSDERQECKVFTTYPDLKRDGVKIVLAPERLVENQRAQIHAAVQQANFDPRYTIP